MKRFRSSAVMLAISAVGLTIVLSAQQSDMPFGSEADVTFAASMWKAMDGYENWHMKSEFYPGKSPHGKVFRLYYNVVTVQDAPYHVIIKDNFGGESADVSTVSRSPDDYPAAVTIMVQREEGYDPDNNDWFWAKYVKDGSLDKNKQGVKLAGRIAKGMNAGCIACHTNAGGGDYIFINDR